MQDELVLIVPRDHPLAGVGRVHKDGLYSLTFVSLNAGSSVQAAQATTLRKHGILWQRLKIDMVRICLSHTAFNWSKPPTSPDCSLAGCMTGIVHAKPLRCLLVDILP